jgi:hypothetical protein
MTCGREAFLVKRLSFRDLGASCRTLHERHDLSRAGC